MDLYTPAACAHPDSIPDVTKMSNKELADFILNGVYDDPTKHPTKHQEL